MQVRVILLAVAVILVASIESKPIWPNVYVGHYPSQAINVHPQLYHYHEGYSPYYVHHLRTAVNAIPAAVNANGKLSVPHIPAYSYYYGTPLYNVRLPLNPVYHVVKPEIPVIVSQPTVPTTVTVKPVDQNKDGVEKLDTKIENKTETNTSGDTNKKDDNDDKESITVHSI